jgi:hypothetical protein
MKLSTDSEFLFCLFALFLLSLSAQTLQQLKRDTNRNCQCLTIPPRLNTQPRERVTHKLCNVCDYLMRARHVKG